MVDETTQLKLPSRIEAIAEATAMSADVASRMKFPDDAMFGIDMAVREAVANAIVHGNAEDETKIVEVAFTTSENELIVTVRDNGKGFDPASIPDPTAEANLLNTSGRGIMFMRTFMDHVEWTAHPAGGTIVRMVKRKF